MPMKQYSDQQIPLPEKSAFFSSHRNRYLTRSHILILFLIFTFASFHINSQDFYPRKQSLHSASALWKHCSAKTILSNPPADIENAETIHRNISYETTISPDTFHYYCLLGQERAGNIKIEISSRQSLSLSFHLYDSKGTLCPPESYTFDPVNHILQIKYHIQADQSYLLGLHSASAAAVSYTIHYKEIKNNTKKQTKPSTTSKPSKKTSKPKGNSKSKNTLQPNNTSKPTDKSASKPKITSKPKNTAKTNTISKSESASKSRAALKSKDSQKSKTKAVSKPIHSSKPKSNTKRKTKAVSQTKNTSQAKGTENPTLPHLTLSRSFTQIRTGNSFSIQAVITPKQTSSLQWSISSDSLIKGKRIKRKNSGEVFSATTVKRGTLIITCRVKGRKRISASCTIKIT